MSRKFIYVPLVPACLLALAWILARPALQVATGYTAKQLCSGLQVSGLPEDFIWQRDVAQRLAVLGPALGFLRERVEVGHSGVTSRFLGVTSRAAYRGKSGCTLYPHTPPRDTPARLHFAGKTPAFALPPADPPPPVEGPLAVALEAAFAEPPGGGRNTLAVLVSYRGKLLAARYLSPVTSRTPLQGWSMNKSLLATWVGMQVARGALSLEQPLQPVLEEASGDGGFADGVSPRLNLGHLLHMESGLDFTENYAPGDDVTHMLYGSDAMWTVAPGTGQAHEPGEHFSYSSGDTNLAAMLWQRSLGEVGYNEWLRREFAQPLGLRAMVSEADASGVQVGSSYTYMLAEDWLRVGQLWLDAWHGRSDLLSRAWQRAAVRPRPSSENGEYGRGFWLNTDGAAFPGLPDKLFYASGSAGQAVVVMPEQELVVVRLGLSASGVDRGLAPLLAAVFAAVSEKGRDEYE